MISNFHFNFTNFCVIICCFFLTKLLTSAVCSCHVTYAFQGESTLYSCMNVNELLAQSRCEIWSLSNCSWTRTHNHLVHKPTLNHLPSLECGFTLKRVRDMKRTYSQMHRRDKYWQYSSIIKKIIRVFVYVLSGYGFESSCSHLHFRFCACFEQGFQCLLCVCFRQLWIVDSLWNSYVTWEEHTVKCIVQISICS